jgi:hypothetical protein
MRSRLQEEGKEEEPSFHGTAGDSSASYSELDMVPDDLVVTLLFVDLVSEKEHRLVRVVIHEAFAIEVEMVVVVVEVVVVMTLVSEPLMGALPFKTDRRNVPCIPSMSNSSSLSSESLRLGALLV